MNPGLAGLALIAATLQPGPDGSIWSGPHVLFMDHEGGLGLQDRGLALFTKAGMQCGWNGHTRTSDLEDLKIERAPGRIVLSGKLRGAPTRFVETVTLDGTRVRVEFQRIGAWPEGFGWAGIEFKIPMGRVRGQACRGDGKDLAVPATYAARREIASGFHRFELCPGEPARNFVVASESPLSLSDMRHWHDDALQLSVGLNREGAGSRESFTIEFPKSAAGANAELRFSPIGYPARGDKLALLEWPTGSPAPGADVTLERRGGGAGKRGRFAPAPDFQGLRWSVFDFSDVRAPGTYRLRWSGGASEWFPIQDSVFTGRADDTLDVFLPWQMCHAEVRGPAAWAHATCHRDDGIRVPAAFRHPDGYISYECEGTPYREGAAVPVGVGGWHDAGDNDLDFTAEGYSTHLLALTSEEFGEARDRATLDAAAGVWTMDRPDGVPDLVQQVEWGVLWLLAMQQPDGRVYVGVVETPERYNASDAPEKGTDGKPGTGDERHVYVDYHAELQLKAMAVFSAAARALKPARPELAVRCLDAAHRAYGYFRTHPEVYRPTVYFRRDERGQGALHTRAAGLAEFYVTTRSPEALHDLEALAPALEKLSVDWPSPRRTYEADDWFAPPYLARLAPVLADGPLKRACLRACRTAAEGLAKTLATRPWPFTKWDFYSFGNSSTALAQVHDAYWLAKALPDVLPFDRAVGCGLWLYGLHPLNTRALVCGDRGPRHLYSSRMHARQGFAGGAVPGAVVPGIGGSAEGGVLSYSDDYGVYVFGEACIYAAAEHVFAMHALARAGF